MQDAEDTSQHLGQQPGSATAANLTGRLLVAMPGMGDPRFEKTVIFICAHSSDGAMGLVVNRPAEDIAFADLLDQLSIPHAPGIVFPSVYLGGPVEHGRGFVLHSGDYAENPATLRVDARFGMTATLDVLKDIATGQGPARSLLALGYSGWGPGQIESELQANAWLVGDVGAAAPSLIFEEESNCKWASALAAMGVDPRLLSAGGGRA